MCELKPHAKSHNSKTEPSERKACECKRETVEKNVVNSGYFFVSAIPKGRACISLDQKCIGTHNEKGHHPLLTVTLNASRSKVSKYKAIAHIQIY